MKKTAMKKIHVILLAAVLMLTFAAGCIGNDDVGDTNNATNNTTNNTTDNNSDGNSVGNGSAASGKILIVYYSRTGNTETVANQIHSAVGGELVQIETVTPYPAEYSDVTAQAQEELNAGYLPPIKTQIDNIDQYDVIFFGYPIWWGRIPPAMMTFLSENDLSGKTIVPFCTHGGSGQSQSLGDIRQYSPNASISESFVVRGSDVSSSQEEVAAWLEQLGYSE